MPEAPQGRGREERALEAVRLARLEDAARRARRLAVLFLVVAEIVQEALDRVGRAQPAREAQRGRVVCSRREDSRGRREKEKRREIFLEGGREEEIS